MSQSPRHEASIDAFWAIPEAERFHEFYGGELVPKAVPSGASIIRLRFRTIGCSTRETAR